MGLYSDYIFPAFFDFVLRPNLYRDFRARVLSAARGRVLEIGVGTGLNLDLYPEHIREIYAIDPNPGMERQLRKKLKGHRMRVNFTRTGAEKLPFPDQYFQTVVSTITLCSIPDLPKALSEIRRVLSKDGQFLFLDHGLSCDAKVAKLQRVLNPLQNVVGCGCSLTVDVEQELKQAGFSIEHLENYYIPKAPKFVGYVYEGRAAKA